jgi:hypothetical protein
MRAIASWGLVLGLALGATQPAMAAPSAKATPIRGVWGPEDLEQIPGTRLLIVSELYATRNNVKGDLALLDTATDRVRPLTIRIAREKGWGDRACLAPPKHIGPHGIHLSRRRDGRLQLLVVNHEERESIELLEVTTQGIATWRGCVKSTEAFNDVVAAPGGGFVATVPTAHGQPEKVDGTVAGFLTEWRPGQGFRKLPGSDAAFNNGVQLSPDGRTLYFPAWTAREIIRYDRVAQRITGRVKTDFMPDNLSVAADGTYLAAGIDGLPGRDCVQVDKQCSPPFTVARLDPRTMTVKTLYHGKPGEMAGASIALQVGRNLYLGSYTGGRILKMPMPR